MALAQQVESWDDDGDFQGDLFTHSVSTVQTSLSSRLSINSESNAADEDWQVSLTPNDDVSTNHAIQSAKQAGVPIPSNIPTSALLGGTIKRLGKKPSRPKLDEAWGEELDIPTDGGLTLKPRKQRPSPQTVEEETDDFDDLEGSLGIRFAGSRRNTRNRSSSASAMSPSLGSQTAESEDDDFRGLELPEGPVDLQAALRNRQAQDSEKAPITDLQIEQPKAQLEVKAPQFLDENDDFFADLDVADGADVFDPKKLTLHKNVKQKLAKPSAPSQIRAPTTTLTFMDKQASATRIPRPVSGSKPTSRLEPVFETGATQVTRTRPQPTTTSAQLLRSKRSMPVMKNNFSLNTKASAPFLAPTSSAAHAMAAVSSKSSAPHLRRDSDPYRAQSPQPRPFSRLSNAYIPDTPSRGSRRPDVAPRDLAREAAAKKTLTKPQRKRFFGDGSELEIFDDLPTSATKEAKFTKQPSLRGPKTIGRIPSRLNLRDHASTFATASSLPDRMATPLPPQTPRSPVKVFQEPSNTPRYLRDTAASRIARETRLGNTARPRSEGPLMPVSTNWKAQIAARSPHASPSAARNKGKRVQPSLIKPTDAPLVKAQKGMTFNPHTHRWEGNENSLGVFDFPAPLPTPTPLPHTQQTQSSYLTHHQPPPSPPRPALIAPISTNNTQNIQVVGGMVFDPVRMRWLRMRPGDQPSANQPSAKHQGAPAMEEPPAGFDEDEEDDPFAGIDDLKENAPGGGAGGNTGTPASGKKLGGLANDEWLVGEEFDLGPEFIRRQKEEEIAWRGKCQSWFSNSVEDDGPRPESRTWRWRIREIAGMPR